MTAGRGLIHEEISPESFKRDGGPLEILQLWVNLPARLKMSPPRYVGLQRDAIPAIRFGDTRSTVNLIAETLQDARHHCRRVRQPTAALLQEGAR
jgi:redox-sensitive bicupin YhaK (pirin superfamily)